MINKFIKNFLLYFVILFIFCSNNFIEQIKAQTIDGIYLSISFIYDLGFNDVKDAFFVLKINRAIEGIPEIKEQKLSLKNSKIKNDNIKIGNEYIYKTNNIIEGIKFSHAGRYIYDIELKEAKVNNGPGKFFVDNQKYRMYFLVKNVNSGFVIDNVYIENITKDKSFNVLDNDMNNKNNIKEFNLFHVYYSQNSDSSQKNSLTISNKVNCSADSNQDCKNKTFRYQMILLSSLVGLNKPLEEDWSYDAYIDENKYQFKKGKIINFELQNDKMMYIKNLPVGTRYRILQEAENDFLPSYTATNFNSKIYKQGMLGNKIIANYNFVENQSDEEIFALNNQNINDRLLNGIVITENKNEIIFYNDYQKSSILNIYSEETMILLIIFVVLVIFLILKSFRSRKYQ